MDLRHLTPGNWGRCARPNGLAALRRRTRRRRKVYSKRRRRRRKIDSGANAVNQEVPERDRATQV